MFASRRRTAALPCVLLAAIAFACFAWISGFGPGWGEQIGERSPAAAWEAGAPIQHLRQPKQTIAARQTGSLASLPQRGGPTPPLPSGHSPVDPNWRRCVSVGVAAAVVPDWRVSSAWPRAPPATA